MGVWIETQIAWMLSGNWSVTPFVGVWIETKATAPGAIDAVGHTLRGCVD